MAIDLNILRNNMKYLRFRRGISQLELASTIHLTRSTYSSYEAGTKVPDLQTIDALAHVYDMSFESLVNHDLTDGLMNRIYFYHENKEIASLLNDFLSLSISSRYLIAQRMNILLEKEKALYKENLRSDLDV